MALPFTFTLVPHSRFGLMVPVDEVAEYFRCAATVAEQEPVDQPERPSFPPGFGQLDPERAVLVTHHHTRADTLRTAADEFGRLAQHPAA